MIYILFWQLLLRFYEVMSEDIISKILCIIYICILALLGFIVCIPVDILLCPIEIIGIIVYFIYKKKN